MKKMSKLERRRMEATNIALEKKRKGCILTIEDKRYLYDYRIDQGLPTEREDLEFLIECNWEFVFTYQNVKYEIVYETNEENRIMLSLYLCDDTQSGKLIKRFENNEDFYANCFIEDKNIMTIVNDLDLRQC